MARICVVTSDGRAYYVLVSRLRNAGFSFVSKLPDHENGECGLILTTKNEAKLFGGRAMALEDLDDDAGVVRGQIVSRLEGGKGTLLIGIDPGLRTGLAAFYGETGLAFRTVNSNDRLFTNVARFVDQVKHNKSVVKIGNGNPALADSLATQMTARLPETSIEIVDESRTSVRGPHIKGVQTDQSAAAKIAFRKGLRFNP